MTNEELEVALAAVTSRLTILDEVIKSERLGLPKMAAFKCNHSGLYYPPDYVKEWGKGYGIGLGPDPVSEALDSDYDTDPPKVTDETRDINDIMHPLRVTRVQMDLVTVPIIDYEAGAAILDVDDPRMVRRAALIRTKQLANSKGKLRALQANWMTFNRFVKG